jgi:hypothetical protein
MESASPKRSRPAPTRSACHRRRRTAVVPAFLAGAVSGLLGTASTEAAWSEPETISLSTTSVEIGDVRLVTSSAGEGVVAWREGASVVRAALRPAAGAFGASQTLDADTSSSGPMPRAGIAPDGSAIVAWFSKTGGRKLRFAERGAGMASFDPATDVFSPPQDLSSLDVVVDSGGAAHVAYNGPGFQQYPRVWTRTRGPLDASFGPESSIPPDFSLSPGAPGQIALATSASGSSVLTYYSPSADVAPLSQAQHIEGAVRSLGDAGWTFPLSGAHDWFCCLSLGPQGVSGLAMDASGRSYFVVNGVNDFGMPPLPGPNFVLVGAGGAVVQGRQQLDPAWSNAGAGGTDGGAPQIAVDPSGNAWVAWARKVGTAMNLYAAFRPAGNASAFAATQMVATGLDASFAGTFRIAATKGGAVLVWQEACGVAGCTLRSAITGAASGAFWRVDTVATETARGEGLQLAPLPADDALATYRRSGGDLEASRFTPPPLRGVAAPVRRKIAKAIAEGIPVTVDVGVADADFKVDLIDANRVLALESPIVGRKVKTTVARRRFDLTVRIRSAAAALIAPLERIKLTVRVTVTPPAGAPEVHRQKLVLQQ